MRNEYKVLFIGDITGRPGRTVIKEYLETLNHKKEYDFIIANSENTSHGFGLTKKNHDELLSYGINCFTSGNHIWDKKDVLSYIDESEALIRPYNYHESTKGVGYRIFEKIIVINLLGKTFMPPIACPFVSLEKIILELKEKLGEALSKYIVFIDFHAEATAEKQCFARFAMNLGVSAVIGTHTHVQTADETIIDNKLAYLTDVGFSGSTQGVIGMEYQGSLKRLITSINERFDIENACPYILNAVEITFCDTLPKSINRINFQYTKQEEKESED